MGNSLRTCKEKFYGGVHAGLATWVGAGREDGWEVGGVREGERGGRGSPRKGGGREEAPRVEVRGLGLGVKVVDAGGWL